MKKAILIIGDLIILYISLFLTLFLRYPENYRFQWNNHWKIFSFIFLFWIIFFYILEFYNIKLIKNDSKFFKLFLKAISINSIAAIFIFYFFSQKLIQISPKTNLFFQILIFSLLFFIWRRITSSIFKLKALRERILIIDFNKESQYIAEEIIKKPQLGYDLAAIFVFDDKLKKDFPEIKIINTLEQLQDLLKNEKIDLIIGPLDLSKDKEIITIIWQILPYGIKFFNLAEFYEKIFGQIPVNINPIWFLERIMKAKPSFDYIKRIFDLFFAIFLLIISLLFWLIIAIIIKLEDNGHIFYYQYRVGKNLKSFKIIKFRSMIENSEKDGAQWTIEGDKRITKIGNFLRKMRLDELPQLLNILKGEMSFIGPRSERLEFHKSFKENIPFYEERYLIKPGLSGWAQVNFRYGSSINDAKEKLKYDLYYIKNRSFLLDMEIILKTIEVVLSGKGR